MSDANELVSLKRSYTKLADAVADLAAENSRLKTQIKLNVDYATQCATVEKERDELLLHIVEVEAQRDEAMDRGKADE